MRCCDGVLWRNKEKIRRGRQHRQQSPEKESGGDAVEFLREKAQMEKELRKEEIAIKKKEQEQEAARQNIMQNMMQNMMQLQQQQQQQVSTMMALVGRLLQEKKYQELFKTACFMSSTVKVVLSYICPHGNVPSFYYFGDSCFS